MRNIEKLKELSWYINEIYIVFYCLLRFIIPVMEKHISR